MDNIPFWKNDFIIVGVGLIVYGHIVCAAWEFLIYAEGKYPISDINPKHRDSALSFFSLFWPLLLLIIIIILITFFIKWLWKTLLLAMKKLLK